MDGTLVDNTPVHIRAFEIFCERYGIRDWKEKLGQAYGMGNDDIMKLIMPAEVIRERGSRHSPKRRNPSTGRSTPPRSCRCPGSPTFCKGSATQAYAAP